ncbi:OmpA family protein [bacterium]|nr:OmpA family protein [bacterium]MBU0900232.1 OmpA family protein [bacterium]MBU1152575.1 OmpA family protein [bacterium]
MKEEEKEEKKNIIIIKKVNKGGHGGGHGGSWKVAYADFVTAMMLFFIVMWLINMLTPSQRDGVASYFQTFSIFEKSSFSVMEKGALSEKPCLSKTPEKGLEKKEKLEKTKQEAMEEKEKELEKKEKELKKKEEQLKNKETTPEVESLKEKLDEKLKNLSLDRSQIKIEADNKGVKIQLSETEGNPLFPKGSPELTPHAKKMLRKIAEDIKGTNYKLIIEGHTDAHPYVSAEYTNWELSTARASKARRELELNGIDAKRFKQVVGYADTELLVKDNPYDSKNRRITVLLLTQ